MGYPRPEHQGRGAEDQCLHTEIDRSQFPYGKLPKRIDRGKYQEDISGCRIQDRNNGKKDDDEKFGSELTVDQSCDQQHVKQQIQQQIALVQHDLHDEFHVQRGYEQNQNGSFQLPHTSSRSYSATHCFITRSIR